MGTPEDRKPSAIADLVKSWIPQRKEPANMSRDFWMPDQSCRVCYDCDTQFTVFNRRHHCRLCGRVFCAKCTTNSVPALSHELNNGREDGDRIRVCNYCFKQWKQGTVVGENTITVSSPGLSSSPSSLSLVSNQSSCYTCNSGSSAGSATYATGPFQQISPTVGQSSSPSVKVDSESVIREDQVKSDGKMEYLNNGDTFTDQFGSCSRSDEDDDDYQFYRSHSDATLLGPEVCSDTANCRTDHIYDQHAVHPAEENKCLTCDSALLPENCETHQSDHVREIENKADVPNSDPPSPSRSEVSNDANVEPVDYENNGLLWLPPEPEDEEDERESLMSEDDDDDMSYDSTEKWGYLQSRSFNTGESRSRDRSTEEHREAMKNVVDGHFRALITQLLQAENLPTDEYNMEESWLDIITSLSLTAANFLKPDTSMGGGMDPGGYVKVKCLASGRRKESMVIKGVVCKKNVAHRRMTSKINKGRMLLLGGALEYQRVPNHLSSFDTLLQQEMDHLKMAVAKIESHHPNILLVERSVSRYAQDYLLAKDISLVLNVKRQLLERIARCTGAQIVPSIDNLSSTKLGYCDSFHVEKYLEDLGSAGQAGKKLTKTLMFFEGCPRPLGCTILLKGASGDELKKVKHVVQYGVFAAYHLSLETSFLADEGARLPELPLTSPIKVALPDRPSGTDRSISTIPGYNVLSSEKPHGPKDPSNPFHSMNDLFLDIGESPRVVPRSEAESFQSETFSAQTPNADFMKDDMGCTKNGADFLDPHLKKPSAIHNPNESNSGSLGEYCVANKLDYLDEVLRNENVVSDQFCNFVGSGQGIIFSNDDGNKPPSNLDSSELVPEGELNNDDHGELGPFNEDFPPRSDQQSILVSLSKRCVWKGIVCDRSHLCRIKYYGNFDKPLGRFLQDQLFDQVYRCHTCEMPVEAHMHCYTHQQGSLTISVRKLPGFLLAGEREGKIWMWHRCLRCPRINGFPPATKRVLMSDAAWGLSFGKFLELSFSNHAAASRVATCGHSIHRDCLRFYGLGRIVACFHYAPIVVHSVYLPPLEVEFNYYEQDWIQKDIDEVRIKATHLFTEVLEAIHQISDKIRYNTSTKAPESTQQIMELELILQMERKGFEESMWSMLNKEVKSGKPAVNFLEMNRLRKKLVFLAYVWDQRLINVPRSRVPNKSSSLKETPVNFREKHAEMNVVSRSGRGFSSWDCSLVDFNPDVAMTEEGRSQNNSPNEVHGGIDKCGTLSTKQDLYPCDSSALNLNNYSESIKSVKAVRRAQSQGHFTTMENLSDNIDTEWAGNQWREHISSDEKAITTSPQALNQVSARNLSTELVAGHSTQDAFVAKETYPPCSLPEIDRSEMEKPCSWVRIPFTLLYESLNKISPENAQKLGMINTYIPVYITSLRELLHVGGGRLLLPLTTSDIVLPVYDDEPTSIIAYALTSPDYQSFMSEVLEKQKKLGFSSSFSILESVNLLSLHSFEDIPSESLRSSGSADQSFLSAASRSFSGLDTLLFSDSLHARVSFSDEGPPGKVKYSVTCYFAKQFEALRRLCCPSELDFVLSLSRCKKWGAQGGKSNVFFAKTLDDRFIIKQVTKTELESFIKFASYYFKYLTESISTGCPTCLAKILGIYQVTSKYIKGGKESKMDVLVMENLLFRRNITRLYDLKGSSRSRYNPDSSGSNKVLLDQNLIEAMPTSPIFLGTKAKRLLERAVWNDTAFLASIDVMDYSLLVGVDEEKHELVLGIIDFMRQYTWDKHLETWVKASGILGGPKNASPTVISPKQYKKRFRKAMSAYFLMVPDQWSSSLNISSDSKSDLNEENRSSPSSQC